MMKSAYSFSVLSSSGLSDEGYVKKKNEDAWEIFELQSGAGALTVGIVADGVTSKAGGATASGLATETIQNVMRSAARSIYDPAALQECIDDAIHQANRAILEEARLNPEIGNMSTTLVVAAVGWGQLQLAYLGDSRAYLLRDKQLHRLTLDHTWAQEALDKGLIDSEDLKNHPNRNVIRRFLGINRQIEIDRQIMKPGHYERNYLERDYTRSLALNQDDVLLLCSDGLTERTTDVEIGSILNRRTDQPQRAVSDLVQLALSRKEQDNITAVVLSLVQERRGSAAIKIMAWAAALVALLVALFVGYNVLRQASFFTSESAAGTSEVRVDSAVAEADGSANVGLSNTGKPESEIADSQSTAAGTEAGTAASAEANAGDSPVPESSGSSAQKSSDTKTFEAQTVPAAETQVALNAQKTAAAAQVETASATPTTEPTATATPLDTSTPIPTAKATDEDSSDSETATADASPKSDSARTVSSLNQKPTGMGAKETNTKKTDSKESTNADETGFTDSESDLGPNQSTDEERTSVASSRVQSTPTRKAPPTAEPTSTPTETPSPSPTAEATRVPTLLSVPTVAATDPIVLPRGPDSANPASQDSNPPDNSLADSGQVDREQTSSQPTVVARSTAENPAAPVAEAETVNQFTFVLPPDRETIQAGKAVAFQWITDYQLSGDQVFEVVIWQPSADKKVAIDHGMGMVDIKYSPPTQIDETTWILQTAPPAQFEAGEYAWAVLVVETEPAYRRIQQIGQESRKFTLEKSGSGGGSSAKDSAGEGKSGGCSGSSCGDR